MRISGGIEMGIRDLIGSKIGFWRGDQVFIPDGVPGHVTELERDDSLYSGTVGSPLTYERVYNRGWAPLGGWDEWCSWAITQGVVESTVHTQAKNMMVGKFTHQDEDTAKAMNKIADKVGFQSDIIQGAIHWLSHGRCFFEPVWGAVGNKHVEFKRLKPVDPWTVRIFWDTPGDIATLKAFLVKSGRPADYIYAQGLQVGTGSQVIGYIQNWNSGFLSSVWGKSRVFFLPEEIIYIPRYPSKQAPEGMSRLRANYRTIQNKIGLEDSQAHMAKRFCEPQPLYTVPKTWWEHPDLKEIKDELKKLWAKGKSLFLPEDWKADLLEPKGNPVGVIRAQEHIDQQYNVGMGTFDSKSNSDSANRSTSETQFTFFETELQPDRKIFAAKLLPIIEEWVGLVFPELGKDVPTWEFEDLTPDDGISRGNVIQPLIQRGLIHKAGLVKFFEDVGYPAPTDEEAEEIIAAARSSGSMGFDPGSPGFGDPGSGNSQRPPNMAALAVAKGIPAGVRTTSSSARDKIIDEIQDMRDDIVSYLDLA